MNEKLSMLDKVGGWFSTILLGKTKEIIIRTDERVLGLMKTLADELKPDLKDVRERFSSVETQVRTLWQDRFSAAHSPRQLNTRGKKILGESGIKEIVDEKKETLTKLVQDRKPTTAYDAERIITSVVNDLPKHCPDIIDRLKDGAFKSGETISTLLFVGGIHLRNEIFSTLGFSLDEIERTMPKTPIA